MSPLWVPFEYLVSTPYDFTGAGPAAARARHRDAGLLLGGCHAGRESLACATSVYVCELTRHVCRYIYYICLCKYRSLVRSVGWSDRRHRHCGGGGAGRAGLRRRQAGQPPQEDRAVRPLGSLVSGPYRTCVSVWYSSAAWCGLCAHNDPAWCPRLLCNR